jgi:hypothetical protein
VLLMMYVVVALLAYGAAFCSLVVMRWTRPKADRQFKVLLGGQMAHQLRRSGCRCQYS